MFSPKAEAPLAVRVPGAADDRPSWMKVGVIAAVGFIAGIVWPRVAGVRLGPAVPEGASASVASASAEPGGQAPSERSARVVETEPQGGSVPAAPAAVVASAVTPASSGAEAPSSGPAAGPLTVGHGAVFACKTSDGDSLKGTACGAIPGFDALVVQRLRKLADCPEASGANGVLHVIVHPDFARGTVGVELGRGQSVSSPEPLLACARADVAGVNLSGIAHDNPRYSVSYRVVFGTGDVAGASSAARVENASAGSAPRPSSHVQDEPPSEGTAQIVWEVALVRDAPKGKIVARLQRGSSVRVGPVKDGWYPVKYGDGFAADGWIYRGALGR
jgi:hypothetical protein